MKVLTIAGIPTLLVLWVGMAVGQDATHDVLFAHAALISRCSFFQFHGEDYVDCINDSKYSLSAQRLTMTSKIRFISLMNLKLPIGGIPCLPNRSFSPEPLHACEEARVAVGDVLYSKGGSFGPRRQLDFAVMTDTTETLNTQAYMAELHDSNEQMLFARIQQAIKEEQPRSEVSAAALTGLIQSIWHGLSALSNRVADREALLATAQLAHELICQQLAPMTS